MDQPDSPLTGNLHIFVAFDWGEEVRLDEARKLVPAEYVALERRSRTPSSIAFRPPPLRYALGHLPVNLPEIGQVLAEVDATVFDFGAVSSSVKIPFTLTPTQLTALATFLADPGLLVQNARSVLTPLYQQLKSAIHKPGWNENLSEEFLVFEFLPSERLDPQHLLRDDAAWMASLVLLEGTTLSAEEISDAVRLHVSYTPSDLFLSDWAAGVLIDRSCEETLQVIEFSNLQLLEYRFIDTKLEEVLATAYRQVGSLSRSWQPPWRMFHQPLRELGELKIDANEVFERTVNVLKLVGDQYLARAYRQLAERFHLKDWEQSIHRKLEVIEGIYKTLADQAATARSELLEVIIVLLIVIEVVMTFVRPH